MGSEMKGKGLLISFTLLVLAGLGDCRLKLDSTTEIKGVKGRSVLLPCEMTGFNENLLEIVNISWHKYQPREILVYTDGAHINITAKEYAGRVRLNPLFQSNMSLLISDLVNNDSTHYRCEVIWHYKGMTKKRSLHKDIFLNLEEVPVSKPVVIEEPGPLVVLLGDPFHLHCQAANGSLPIEYYWYKHKPTDIRTVRKMEMGMNYSIESTKARDGGLYHCAALNTANGKKLKERSNLVEIIVAEPPPKPVVVVDPPIAALVFGQPVHLFCTVPVIQQNIQYRWRKDKLLLQSSSHNSSLQNLTLHGLAEKQSVTYECSTTSNVKGHQFETWSDKVELSLMGDSAWDSQILVHSASGVGISLFILLLAGLAVLFFKVHRRRKTKPQIKSLSRNNSENQHKISRNDEDQINAKAGSKSVEPYIERAQDLKKAAVLREKMEAASWNYQYNALRMNESQNYTSNLVQPYVMPKPKPCIKEVDNASLDSTYAVPAALCLNIPMDTDSDEIYDVPPRRM
ncbi:Fc receptor-like protein 5 [Leucoraja erinacea]|uniref:Fc receptor-like protein 5 n=1 Tax=Leucoraja erinaceus TaxID=7782 RepID=UPI002457BEE7|nr:Fc receptor-like protein 5 [Leucoraja erinacea]